MKKEDVAAFKRELENYSYYKSNLKLTLDMIEYKEYLLSNVKGIDPSKEPGLSNITWVESDAFDKIANDLERLNRHRELRIKQIEYIESILDRLAEETRNACIEIYVNGETYARVSNQYYLSKRGLFYRIEKELDGVL